MQTLRISEAVEFGGNDHSVYNHRALSSVLAARPKTIAPLKEPLRTGNLSIKLC